MERDLIGERITYEDNIYEIYYDEDRNCVAVRGEGLHKNTLMMGYNEEDDWGITYFIHPGLVLKIEAVR